MAELAAFLAGSRERLSGAPARPLLVVMGSAAADVDSLAGSVSYAYLRHQEPAPSPAAVPVARVTRQELGLRPEAVALFRLAGLELAQLPCADEVDLAELVGRRATTLALVDDDGRGLARVLYARVREVVDHHPAAEPPPRTETRLLAEVGSACTLVGEEIFRRRPGLMQRELATLLLGAVLLDTANLAAQAGRATARDLRLAERLLGIADLDGDGLYGRLLARRQEPGELGSPELLRRDCKEERLRTVPFGLASVPLTLQAWWERDPGLARSLEAFRRSRGLELLLVLLYRQERSFRRQLVVCASSGRLMGRVVQFLQELPLKLSEIPAAGAAPGPAPANAPAVRFFEQGATEVSRKALQPLLRSFLEGL
jgi:exopolyphosphatase